MSSNKASASGLAQAVKNLNLHWQQTQNSWRDSRSEEFERKYIDALPGMVAQASAVIDDLNIMLQRIRRDCE